MKSAFATHLFVDTNPSFRFSLVERLLRHFLQNQHPVLSPTIARPPLQMTPSSSFWHGFLAM